MSFSTIDTLWVLLATALVFFMQAGFAMVETGFTRAKNAGNIVMKNMMDFAFGSLVFWAVGFGIMYGTRGNLFWGGIDLFILDSSVYDGNVPGFATIMFQTVFCATAATIVSGAMAERTKFKSYLVYSVIISAFVYPISGHWIWGGGWLSELGFIDFAGSTAVHMVGGTAALVGAKMVGPRIGKYSKSGKPRAIPGHSVTLGALGVFILWLGWFGFNGGSTLGLEGLTADASLVFMNTNIAAAAATAAVMALTWVRYKKPDVSMTLNGSLAGLVAITAGCHAVEPWAAALIGIIAGGVLVFAVEFVDGTLRIDDPVGAVGVHGVCGALGTLLVGVFSTDGGLFYGGGFRLLSVQFIGVLAVGAWVAVSMFGVFWVIKKTMGLRVFEEEELAGLDKYEHGLASAYADFALPVVYGTFAGEQAARESLGPIIAPSFAAPYASVTPGVKFTNIVIITRQSKFEDLKTALGRIGVTGMTVTQVLGCGQQRGAPEYYRGAKLEMALLPKIKVEIVVSAVPVRKVIETAKAALWTGHIGDGKIFVFDVENVVKVRTGQEGFDALQDD
jgi:Amt family ammonium transporter